MSTSTSVKPPRAHVGDDPLDVVVAVRDVDEEQRRVEVEGVVHPRHHRAAEPVPLHGVPGGEQQPPAGCQHAAGLGERGGPVGEEHHAELAGDEVEAGVAEREPLGVGHRPPRLRDRTGAPLNDGPGRGRSR